jgi:hypothetical protein
MKRSNPLSKSAILPSQNPLFIYWVSTAKLAIHAKEFHSIHWHMKIEKVNKEK